MGSSWFLNHLLSKTEYFPCWHMLKIQEIQLIWIYEDIEEATRIVNKLTDHKIFDMVLKQELDI